MCKIVILSNDFKRIRFLFNNILNKVSGIQISGICSDIKEFDLLVEKTNPNIIIMNYTDYIESKYCNKEIYKKSKIIFCDSKTNLKNTSTQLLISKNLDSNEIVKSISDFILKQNKKLLRKKIIKLLETSQFDFKLIGTTYILESILYCYENKSDYIFENLEKNVYPYIAQKCHTDLSKVKWAISRATNNMNFHIDKYSQKLLSDNYNLDISEKTSSKQLITAIVTKLS